MVKSQNQLFILLLLSILLNFSDAILTLYGVNTGLVDEINPIMNYFIQIGPITFIIVKELILAVVLWYIWSNQNRGRITALSLAGLIVITFAFINIWNINTFWNVGLLGNL